jgi:hypothetical protein
MVAGRPDECEAAAYRRLDRGSCREHGSLERRRGADRLRIEQKRILHRANELYVLGGVTKEQFLHRRGAALAPVVLIREEHRKPFGALQVVAGRV